MASKLSASRLFWLGALFLFSCFAKADVPRFENYKVDEVFKGQQHDAVASDENKSWAEGRKKAIKQPVNFAGHYVVYANGCGGGSICGEILDVKTGQVVTSFPNAYYIIGNDGTAPYAAVYKPDSKLLEIMGVAADPEVDVEGNDLEEGNRQRFYEFDGKKLTLIELVDQ
jgi:hypothetical protein